jgi:hypothetical protein
MFEKQPLPRSVVSLALLSFGLAAGPARADMIFNALGVGSDGDLMARADFTIANGVLTILLTNLEPNERSIGQAISGLSFTIDGAPVTSASVTSATGTAVSILSANSTAPAAASTDRWQVNQISGNTISTTVLSGGQPTYLIAGPPDNSGNYPNANTGMEVHSPVFVGKATLLLTVGGLTACSAIKDVVFSFGTGPDTLVPGVDPPVPEPSSIVLLGISLACLAWFHRRRIRCSVIVAADRLDSVEVAAEPEHCLVNEHGVLDSPRVQFPC